MKKRWRCLSFVLAAAMAVTSVPTGYGMTAQAAETDQTQGTADQKTVLLKWNETEGNGVSEDGRILTAEAVTFESTREYVEGLSSTEASLDTSSDAFKTEIKKVFGIAENAEVTIDNYDTEFSYQWYQEDAAGNRKKLEGETSSSLRSYYYDENEEYQDRVVTAAEGSVTYICEISLTELMVTSTVTDAETGEETETEYYFSNLPPEAKEPYYYTAEQVFPYQYTGPTAESFGEGEGKLDLKTYFSFDENDKAEEVELETEDEEIELEMPNVGVKNNYNNPYDISLNYQWIVNYTDQGTEVIDSGTVSSSFGAIESIWVERTYNGKQAANYECQVELCCNGIVVKNLSKTFQLVYHPIRVITPAENTVQSRVNGKQTFQVDAEIKEEQEDNCKGILYQWYQIGKDGKESPLEGETANTLKVKITDPSISYKCQLKGEWADTEDAKQWSNWNKSVLFKVETVAGYLLRDRAPERVSVAPNEETELFVDASVDPGYTMSYQWERADARADTSEIVFTDLKTDAPRLKVKPESDKDFETYWVAEDQKDYRYRLTVNVKDSSQQVVDTQRYYFSLDKAADTGYDCNENEGSRTYLYGESAKLYAVPAVNGKHMVKQTWYYLLDTKVYYEKYNSETGEDEKIFVNSQDFSQQIEFQEPVCDATERERLRGESVDGSYRNYYQAYYYKILNDSEASRLGVALSKDSTTLSVTSLKETTRYYCKVDVYRLTNQETPAETHEYSFELNIKTDLNAYAKNSEIQCKEGEKAVLEVAAQNCDVKNKPLTYTWKKYNEDKGAWDAVENTGAKYEIAAVKAADYGKYQVKVSDGMEEKTVEFTLIPVSEDLKVVVYTPKRASFNKSIGDKVTLKAGIDFSVKPNVFYEWYHREQVYNSDGWSDEEDWELTNVDTDQYDFELKDENQYGTYKCVATYKDKNVSYSQEFFYTINPVTGTFICERMTPTEQYKKIGDSITYTVRLFTDISEIKDTDIKYQWYYYDENDNKVNIEGADSASYTIEKLTAENFKSIYCKVTAGDPEKEPQKYHEALAYFATYLYTDMYLKNTDAEAEAEIGSDVTLSPQIVNFGEDQQGLAYQWYRIAEYYDEDYEEYDTEEQKIYGAISKEYTIKEIGANEFGTYLCKITLNGMDVGLDYTVTVAEKEAQEEETTLTAAPAEGVQTSIRAALGSPVKLAVTAASNKGLKLRYQWYRNNQAMGGEVSASYEIARLTPGDCGSYRCAVTDPEGNTASVSFYVARTGGLSVTTDSMNTSDVIGYQTAIGEDVTLKATAATNPDYQVFYQWYKADEDGDYHLIKGQTAAALELSEVSEDDLGYYLCRVYNEVDSEIYLNYKVYINTGLVVEPSSSNVRAAKDGSVKMYVDAWANKGETISYQWFKYDDAQESWKEIESANKSAYTISKLKKADYGEYGCAIFTRGGEILACTFELYPQYEVSADRMYATKGDQVTFAAKVVNPAADVKYSYEWFAKDVETGTYMKTGKTSASYKAKMPAVSGKQTGMGGYANVAYQCVIKEDGEIAADDVDAQVRVLPPVAYSKKLLETNHPYDKRYSTKGYQDKGAEGLIVTFDKKTDINVTVIDGKGNMQMITPYFIGMGQNTITLEGDSFILLTGSEQADSYGYKVASVKRTVPAKGTKYTSKNVVYQVTKSAAKNGTVSVTGMSSKSQTKAEIPATVKIDGYTFNVTAIDKNACKGCKKLKTVTIGKNVTSIGSSAFDGCKSLKTITIQSTKLKTVGSNAFKGIASTAKIKVPASKLKAYQKLLKGKGQGKKVKITK